MRDVQGNSQYSLFTAHDRSAANGPVRLFVDGLMLLRIDPDGIKRL
jgi:hypothetical protein